MVVDYANFYKRADRTKYVFEKFEKYLGGNVLDVGCDKAVLKTLLAPNIKYTGIDVAGKPDILLDLEKIERLPFDDSSFDCVICSDVLEHLDNLYFMFAELIRVTRGYVIVSWPNGWAGARMSIWRGEGAFKHYGLPPEKTADRHKWFFNLTEAENFVRCNVAKSDALELVEERITEKPRLVALRAMRRLLYPQQQRYFNRYAHTLWTVLRKNVRG
jgi:2-polyprenyl-3-methyl-5-hydroxy-6-metoxy-1,4-benzoquinol methylase